MPGSSEEDNDSRTASVGLQRSRVNNGNNQSLQDSTARPHKRQKRGKGNKDDGEVRDFVPQGATFSANSLQVDPDSTSSSGSDSADSADSTSDEGESDGSDGEPSPKNPNAGTTAPAINWNQGSKRAVRTTLGRRTGVDTKKPEESTANSQFEAVNGAYWRSRSDSASTGNGEKKDGDEDMEEGEVHENGTAGAAPIDSDSDDSESLDSRADDSIMLNIGSRSAGKQNGQVGTDDDDDDYDPETHPILDQPIANGRSSEIRNETAPESSKEEAFHNFTQLYPTAPALMSSLVLKDMEIQDRYMYWTGPEGDIYSPVVCTECLRKGHIARVCPSKEVSFSRLTYPMTLYSHTDLQCIHCGAWNKHDSNFCPSWRRCQRCRERGHDEAQCSSLLKSSASEVPCDLCGSPNHLEHDCDYMWKLPLRNQSSRPMQVSISCSHCTSNHHLMGDCPSLPRPITSSTWTLQGIDPNLITNLNSVLPSRRSGGPMPRGRGGMKIRGRADRSPTPDSDDDMFGRPGRRPPLGRPPGRANIRIGGGIGRGKNLGPNYRDRQDSFGDRSRQRSMSPGRPGPGPGPGRGRGRDNYNVRSRSPPRRGRPPPRGGGGGGRGRGGGKRGGGNGETYRPLPGAAKKAWDRYRL